MTLNSSDVPGPVLVMGAGAVGCYIGGCLAAAGVPVTFVGRPRVLQALAGHGLTLTDLDGARRVVPAAQLSLSEAVGRAKAAAGLRGAARRFTGSYETGSFTPDFPVVSWIADRPPPGGVATRPRRGAGAGAPPVSQS